MNKVYIINHYIHDIDLYKDEAARFILQFNNDINIEVHYDKSNLILTFLNIKIPWELCEVLKNNKDFGCELQINYTNIYTELKYLNEILKVIKEYSENLVFI